MTGTRTALLALLLNALFASLIFAQDSDSAIIIGNVRLTGEAGLAFFDTGSDGQFPNSEFLLDEGKLFVEAPLGAEIYGFVEVNLRYREEEGDAVEIGELYLDFEHVLRSWNREKLLNIRVGRIDIPFGEEYLTRDAIDNPLISHSITDFWGVDEGVMAYGSFSGFHYAVAVLNGGNPFFRDFNTDKSVTGRLTYDFPKWVHLAFSAMRTGELEVHGDALSELWVANGFYRSLGSGATTHFGGNLYLGEAELNWIYGHFRAGIGELDYFDNDPLSDNKRDAFYFQLEAVQELTQGETNLWHAAMRFGRIESEEGFPFTGHGDRGLYFFGPDSLSANLWRWTLGIGYRPNRNVLLKVEYTIERGEQLDGSDRDEEDFFGVEAAFRF